MAKRKGDIEIGHRAAEELFRVHPGISEKAICKSIGNMDRKSLWFWKNGATPDGFALQQLCYAGCDIEYILTGRRYANGKEND